MQFYIGQAAARRAGRASRWSAPPPRPPPTRHVTLPLRQPAKPHAGSMAPASSSALYVARSLVQLLTFASPMRAVGLSSASCSLKAVRVLIAELSLAARGALPRPAERVIKQQDASHNHETKDAHRADEILAIARLGHVCRQVYETVPNE